MSRCGSSQALRLSSSVFHALQSRPVFADTAGWNAEYHKYHSPSWWQRHFASIEELDVGLAEEVPDGDVMWEDDVLYRCERAGWDANYIASSAWLMRHIVHGKTAPPSLTHCIVVATRTEELKEEKK